jgi:Family of unknown function (DUF5709)
MTEGMSEDQLQSDETLDDRGVKDVLDEGYSPPEREPHHLRHADGGDTLDDELAAEEPEVWADGDERDRERDEDSSDVDIMDDEDDVDGEVGEQRTGRLTAPDEGSGEDVDQEMLGTDQGIDGSGASAEEAAMHTIEE